MRRRWKWVGVAAALGCSPAAAHSRLAGSEPAAGATVEAPATLRLKFSEAVEPGLTGAVVLCAGRDIAAKAARADAGAASIEIDLAPAPAGLCEVRWRAVSVDGHRTEGAFRFTIR